MKSKNVLKRVVCAVITGVVLLSSTMIVSAYSGSGIARPTPEKMVDYNGNQVRLDATTNIFQIEESQYAWDSTIPANGNVAKGYGIETVDETDTFPEGYSFGPRVREDTTVQSFGGMNESDGQEYCLYRRQPHGNSALMRIEAGDMSKKATFGMLYKNVGSYKGRIIDCKVTIVDYEFIRYGGAVSKGAVLFYGDEIAITAGGLNWCEVKYEYLDNITGEAVDIKAYISVDDVDFNQGMEINKKSTNLTGLYVPADSNLRVIKRDENIVWYSDSIWYNTRGSNSGQIHFSLLQDQFLFTFEGSSQVQRYWCNAGLRKSNGINNEYYKSDFIAEFPKTWKDADCDAVNAEVPVTINGVKSITTFGFSDLGSFFSYGGQPMAKSPISPLEKYVSDRNESLNRNSDLTKNTLQTLAEEYTYHLYHNVPDEVTENHYDSYVITDELENCLEYVSAKVYDGGNKDVTALFTISNSGQKVTFMAKNTKDAGFYYKDYRFDINVKIKDDTNMAKYVTEIDKLKTYQIPNKASIAVVRDGENTKKDSNDTLTTIMVGYSDVSVRIVKVDSVSKKALPSAEFTLYEWTVSGGNKYVEKQKLAYIPNNQTFEANGLTQKPDNQGKFKVVETKVPNKYTGAWEKEFIITADGQTFIYNVENTPVGKNSIRKTATVTSHKGEVKPETGSTEQPVAVEHSDSIHYNLYIKRDSALGYKSGELTVTDKIPTGSVWSTDTLNITGIINASIVDSTAKVESMSVSGDTITWKLSGLDNNEEAQLGFSVTAPSEKLIMKNEATLNDPQDSGTVPSNEVTHETYLSDLGVVKSSNPAHGSKVSDGQRIDYIITMSNNGEAPSHEAIISDNVPTGTTYVAGSLVCSDESAIISDENNSMSATIPVIEVGATVNMVFSVTVNSTNSPVIIKNVAYWRDSTIPPDEWIPTDELEHPVPKLQVVIKKSDALSGINLADAEFALYQWSASANDYVTKEKLGYDDTTEEYKSSVAGFSEDNQGKYKVVETKVPDKYTGAFEQEMVVNNDKFEFEYDVKNTPTGETLIEKKTDIITDNGERKGEQGTTNTPRLTNQNEIIEYILYVTRDSAPSYKSGEVTITDAIPEGVIWAPETLDITGDVINANEQSDAVVKSMDCDEAGNITWLLAGLDNGEVVRLSFQVKVPYADMVVSNVAHITDPQDGKPEPVPSNLVENEVITSDMMITKLAKPEHMTEVEVGDTITYTIRAKNEGRGVANNVQVIDGLPSEVAYVDGSLACTDHSAELSYKDGVIRVTLAKVDSGGGFDVTFDVTVNESNEAKTIKNKAVLIEDGKEPESSNEIIHHLKTPLITEKQNPQSISKKNNGNGTTGMFNKKQISTPNTGDKSQMQLWLVFGAIALIGSLGILITKKKSY